jgi:hypothetical protein
MEPATIAAIAGGLGKGAEAIGNYSASSSSGKNAKKAAKISAKEKKRKTKADLLSQALERAFESSKESRSGQREMSANRMKSLMDVAANIRAALAK